MGEASQPMDEGATPRTEVSARTPRGLRSAFNGIGKMFSSGGVSKPDAKQESESTTPRGGRRGSWFGGKNSNNAVAAEPTPARAPPATSEAPKEEVTRAPIWTKAVETASADTAVPTPAPSRFLQALKREEEVTEVTPAPPTRFMTALGQAGVKAEPAPPLPLPVEPPLPPEVPEDREVISPPVSPAHAAPPEPPMPEVLERPESPAPDPAPPQPPETEIVEAPPLPAPSEAPTPAGPSLSFAERVAAGSAVAAIDSKPGPPPKPQEPVEAPDALGMTGSRGGMVMPKIDTSDPLETTGSRRGMVMPKIDTSDPLEETTASRDGMAKPESPSLYRPNIRKFPGMPDSPSSNGPGIEDSPLAKTTPPRGPPPPPPKKPESPFAKTLPGPPLGDSPQGIQRMKMNGSLKGMAEDRNKVRAPSPLHAEAPSNLLEPESKPISPSSPSSSAPGKAPPPPPAGGKPPKSVKGPGPKFLGGLLSVDTDLDLEGTINSTASDMSAGSNRPSPNAGGGRRGLSLGGLAKSSAVQALPKPPSPSGSGATTPAAKAKALPGRPSTALAQRPQAKAKGESMPPPPPMPPGMRPGVASSPKAGGPVSNAW